MLENDNGVATVDAPVLAPTSAEAMTTEAHVTAPNAPTGEVQVATPAPAKKSKDDGPYFGCREKAQAGQINRVLFEADGPMTAAEIAKKVSEQTPEYKCGAGRVESHCNFWIAEKRQIGKLLKEKDGKYFLTK